MYSASMKKLTLNILLLLSILSAFTACKRPKSSTIETENLSEAIAIGDTVQALGDSLWYIFQDKKRNYWFGSNGEGVYRYDGKIILNFTTKDGLFSNSIRQIQEDGLGNIYFSTVGGISRYDGKSISTLMPIESKDWKLQADDLWFHVLGSKEKNGPYRYDGKQLYRLEFPENAFHEELLKTHGSSFFNSDEVYTTYKDRHGAIWFGTAGLGACRFDGQTHNWIYEKDLTETPNGGSFGIRSIYEDKTGKFWFCNTLHRYQIDAAKTAQSDRLIYNKTPGIGDAASFGGDAYVYYFNIIEDLEGNLWLTTWDQGVFKYDGENITHFAVQDDGKDVNLVSMYKDREGKLWLGTPENGVFVMGERGFERFGI